jgi:hypothetical protein
VRPLAVLVLPPSFDHPRGLGERAEPVLVQAFVPESADEALDERVLDWPAGLNEAQPYAGPRRPGEQRDSGPLSMTISAGRPWRQASSSSRRTTRAPPVEKSGRTALSNQIRAFCLEYGIAMRKGAGLLKLEVATALENHANDLMKLSQSW